MNFASEGKINIYFNEDGIQALKNGELIDSDFEGKYMRIKKGKEVEIHSYDLVTSYKYKLPKVFKFKNILDIESKNNETNYENPKNRKELISSNNKASVSSLALGKGCETPSSFNIFDISKFFSDFPSKEKVLSINSISKFLKII